MSKKIALITGANGNLGKAVVKSFLDEDWQVIGLVHHAIGSFSNNPNYTEKTVDLLEEQDCQEVISDLIKSYGHIDLAVLTAGGFKMGDISKTQSKDLQQLLNLNFMTAYHITRPLLLEMEKKNSGKIFFIGSGQGMNPHRGKGVVAYSLSKSLLFHLSEIINSGHSDRNIQSFVIVPGTIDTPQNRKDMPDADFTKWETPVEIAGLIHDYAEKKSDKTILVVKDELKKGK